MKIFFEHLQRILRDHYFEVEVVDEGPTTHKDSQLNKTFSGRQGVYRIDPSLNDTSFSEIEAYGQGPLYRLLTTQMNRYRDIESFEVTTRRDMIIVAVYYRSPQKVASSAPPVGQVLQRMLWIRGRTFANLQEGLKELGGDLLGASRTLPIIRSYQPDQGKAEVRLITLRGETRMETIRLIWMRKDMDTLVLRVDLPRGW